jgi:hypothetical protein
MRAGSAGSAYHAAGIIDIPTSSDLNAEDCSLHRIERLRFARRRIRGTRRDETSMDERVVQ